MHGLSGIAKTFLRGRDKVAEDVYDDKLEPGYGGTYANDIPKYKGSQRRDTKSASDIVKTWTDPKAITQDVREYLMMLFQEQAEDYKIEDAIKAIEQGIQEFRKITNV